MRRGAARTRAWFVIAFVAVSVVVSWLTTSHQLATYEDITNFLLYLLVPWTAINLVDYFIIRHGAYDIDQLLDRGGIYGRLNSRAVAIYVLAFAAELPFADSTVYEGPVAAVLHGADVAWLVGLVIAGGVYYLSAPRSKAAPGSPGVPRAAHVAEPPVSDTMM